MGVGHEHDGLFGIIDMYGEGLAFFKDGDAYPYASGFSDAAEAMGFRIAWNREQDKSLQIESVICEKHGVGMTKDGDLILSAFRARLVDVGGRFGKGHSNIYGLDDCRIHGGLLPIVEFYDMDVNRDRYSSYMKDDEQRSSLSVVVDQLEFGNVKPREENAMSQEQTAAPASPATTDSDFYDEDVWEQTGLC